MSLTSAPDSTFQKALIEQSGSELTDSCLDCIGCLDEAGVNGVISPAASSDQSKNVIW